MDPGRASWRLNERHYGALQGLNKAETAAKFGDAQVKIWRRSLRHRRRRRWRTAIRASGATRATPTWRRASFPRPSA